MSPEEKAAERFKCRPFMPFNKIARLDLQLNPKY